MPTDVEQLLSALPSASITRASRHGLILTPQLKTAEREALLGQVVRLMRNTTGARQTLTAWLGDVLAYGGGFGRGRMADCALAAGLDAGTLRNAKMVCQRIPVSCRHDNLSWTHHCEVGLTTSEPAQIEYWLALAEKETLSTAELRRRIRASLAVAKRWNGAENPVGSTAPFRLMRELRAGGRMLLRQRNIWQDWSPSTARLALQELQPLTEFVDDLRARALETTKSRPRDPSAN